MNEPTQEELPSSDLSRRKMLQRSAFVVGAAAVWSTPIVQTLGQRPAAAATPERADFCDEEGDPPPVWLIWEYLPGECAGSDAALEACSTTTLPSGNVDIKITRSGGPSQGTWWVCDVAEGETFYTEGNDGKTMNPSMVFEIYAAGNGTLLQSVRVHTSCSEVLNILDRFASIRLRGGETEDGAAGLGADAQDPSKAADHVQQDSPC